MVILEEFHLVHKAIMVSSNNSAKIPCFVECFGCCQQPKPSTKQGILIELLELIIPSMMVASLSYAGALHCGTHLTFDIAPACYVTVEMNTGRPCLNFTILAILHGEIPTEA